MRVEPASTVDDLLTEAGWVGVGNHTYVSPDLMEAIQIHVESDYGTVPVEVILEDLRELGLDDLADDFLVRINQR